MQINDIELLPGDTLLYATADLADWVIELKTGAEAAHVEKYIGDGQSVASRNGIGVGQWPARVDGCVAILRPFLSIDIARGMAWFATVNHEGYDWNGLLNFFRPGDAVTPHALFCSAFATEFDWRCGFDAVHRECPSNKISPGDFLKLPGYEHLWVKPA